MHKYCIFIANKYQMARLFISFITKQYFYAFFPIKKLVCFKIITNFVRVKTVKLH